MLSFVPFSICSESVNNFQVLSLGGSTLQSNWNRKCKCMRTFFQLDFSHPHTARKLKAIHFESRQAKVLSRIIRICKRLSFMALLKNFYGIINCLNTNKMACVSVERKRKKWAGKIRKKNKQTKKMRKRHGIWHIPCTAHTHTQKNDKFTHEMNNNQRFKIANCVLISFIHEPFFLA